MVVSQNKKMPPVFTYMECVNGAWAEEFGGAGPMAGGLTLSWRDLNVWGTRKVSSGFWKKTEYERVQLLDSVSGSIHSGTLTAIMGPSGAGKTTLLAAVSMRVQGHKSGQVLLNEYPVGQKLLSGISGFVPQQDLVIESITVQEHMYFMARLTMDWRTKDSTRKRRIHGLLREMGMSKCLNAIISSLSGGERKRLSLAVQLLNDPPILFCDEPTSGLDSWAAAAVVSRLRALAAAGRAVLCVLHQPSSGTFQLFDRLILLTSGRVAYSGPLKEASDFFKRLGYMCPVGYNEAEFLVNMVSEEDTAKSICRAWDISEATRDLHGVSIKHHGYHEMTNGIPLFKPKNVRSFDGEAQYLQYFSIEKPGKFVQFYYLLWRSYMAAKNDKNIWLAEFLCFLGLAFIVAIPFQNLLSTIRQEDIQNIQGLMYLIVTETIFMFIYSVFHHFPSEIAVLLRELANGIYTPGPYYFSKIIFMIPRAIIEPFLYTTFIFWVVGLRGGFNGFILLIIPVIFSANCANAYGVWLSATFESIATASLVSVPIDFLGMIFVGNFINLSSVSVYVGWLKYFSIFFYSAEAISILQWENIDTIECDTRAGLPCIKTGLEVLDFFGFGENNYLIDLLGMLLLYIGFHMLGYISLLIRSKKEPVY